MMNQDTVKRSYQLLSLLKVCEAAADDIGGLGDGERIKVSGSLSFTLELAQEIAGEIHDQIEEAAKDKAA